MVQRCTVWELSLIHISEILDKDIIPMPDDFDIENYTKEVFFMFSGEKVLVDLRCDNSLMKTCLLYTSFIIAMRKTVSHRVRWIVSF